MICAAFRSQGLNAKDDQKQDITKIDSSKLVCFLICHVKLVSLVALLGQSTRSVKSHSFPDMTEVGRAMG